MKSIFLESIAVPLSSAESRRRPHPKPAAARLKGPILLLLALSWAIGASATTVNSNCITPNPLVFTTAASTPLLTLSDANFCDDFNLGLHNLNSAYINTVETVTATGASGTTYRFIFASYADPANFSRPQYTVTILGQVGTGPDFVRLGIDPNALGVADTPIDIQITLPPSTSPTITSVSPTAGSTAGGTSTTITGTNFAGASAVHFGTSTASFVVNSTTQITATAPAHAAGTVDITVTTSNGTNTTSSADQFTYVAPVNAGAASATVAYGSSANAITLNTSGGAPTSVAVASAASHGTATASGTSITYTPTSGYFGSDSFTYTATNAAGTSAPATVTITVSAPTITVTPTTLANGSAGTAYNRSLTAAGGQTPYTFSTTLATGALPAGLSLSSAGAITGTPTATGTFTFTVTGTDSSTTTHATFTSSAISLTIAAPTIAIAPATLPAPTTGTAYSRNVTASGGSAPYTFVISAGALPAGLTLSSAGVLSGTPTAAGSVTFTVRGTDSNGFSGSRAYSFFVAAPTITISPSTLPSGTGGSSYIQPVTATGGNAPYTYAVASGTLPTGLTLNASTGAISGTPTAAGTYNFTLAASDSSTGTGSPFYGSRSYSLTIAAPTIAVAPATLPAAAVPTAYNQTVAASGGTGPYVFSVGSGAVPSGLTLSSSGILSGTPTAAATFNFTVNATDSNNFAGSRSYTVSVAAPTIAISPATLPGAVSNTAYSQTVTASNGTAPYSYAVLSGSLPPGLTLNANLGVLSGTPTATGTYSFTIRATDSTTGAGAPFTATRGYTLTSGVPPPTAGAVNGTIPYDSVAFPVQLVLGGGAATSVAVASPALHGTAVASGTSITYTPAPGYFGFDTFTYTASNAGGTSTPATVTCYVSPPIISVTPSTLTAGSQGTAYSQMLIASGGQPPYTFSTALASGALPPGLALSSSGLITGTPSASGTFNFNVTGTDSSIDTHATFASTTIFLTINASVPGAPTIGVATGGDAQASVAFTPPISNGGATITGYTVTATPGGITGSGTISPITVTGLTNGTPYTFKVTATNIAGTGTASAISNSVTPLALPVSGAVNVTVAYDSAANPVALALSGGTPASVAIASASGHGTATATGTAITYTPATGYFGVDSFTYTATNSSGTSLAGTVSITVSAPIISVTPSTLPTGAVHAAYGQPLTINGGASPYLFSTTLASGSLPAGLSLSGGGVISGTPTAAGTFSFTVTGTDSSTSTHASFTSGAITLAISPPSLSIAPATGTALSGTAQTSFTQSFAATGGSGAFSYALAINSGTLPAGLTFSASTGTLSGTPTAASTVNFTITATDALSTGLGSPFTIAATYVLTVSAPAISLTPVSLATAVPGSSYSQTLIAGGGAAPYTYAITAGALPAGISLAGGVLTGTPTAAGTFNFTVTATDALNFTGIRSYTLAVAPATVSIAPSTLPNFVVGTGVTYSRALAATGGTAPYTFSLTAGALPTGLTLSPAGLISGVATTGGTYTFSVTATDSTTGTGPFSGSTAYTVASTLSPPIANADTSTTPANQPVTLSVAANDTGTIASVAVAAAPLHGTAAISGLTVLYTPKHDFFGSDSFTYTATGPGGTSSAAAVSITVAPLPTPASPPQTATAVSSTSMTMHPAVSATRGPFVSLTIVTQPSSGTVVVKGLDIIYLPDRSITTTTTVTFSYTITNAFGTSSPVIVTVTVKPSTQKVSFLDPPAPAGVTALPEDSFIPEVPAKPKGRAA